MKILDRLIVAVTRAGASADRSDEENLKWVHESQEVRKTRFEVERQLRVSRSDGSVDQIIAGPIEVAQPGTVGIRVLALPGNHEFLFPSPTPAELDARISDLRGV